MQAIGKPLCTHFRPASLRRPAVRRLPRLAASGPPTPGLDESLEVAVPSDQRPVNQLKELKEGGLYKWATLETPQYLTRLAVLWVVFFTLVGAPISYQTFDPAVNPVEFFLSGATGASLVVAVAVTRIYLGWSYIGNRLLSATVDYEETGWYDGQTFVKPPEVLARDRLLGNYEVRPTLRRLKSTLIGSGATLATISIVLSGLIGAGMDENGMYGRAASAPVARQTAGGLTYGQGTDITKLAADDDLAAAEAAAQGGRPGFCGNRYYRAAAGGAGSACSKYDP